MASSEFEFPARGTILGINGTTVTFAPAGTSYQLHLHWAGAGAGEAPPIGPTVEIFIHVDARKIYTVPSGGNFVAPIFGPPKIIQGRVRAIEGVGDNAIVVHAGTNFIVNLPQAGDAIDLNSGPIAAGALVNAIALPGARMEWAAQRV